ncbi:aromatic amino acid transport family protein [Parachlamydia sp. AcF125]|uniref:amino acid permease n=1 Tax=Parachlamydia sp. AcF125 TaxID=2795736 RepID=UPI001BC988F6|nr:aromatic amino acid transport family protein [Parachlamydia sp. AcF125]MBS4167828.1 Tyrosine-specific transport protein [Parachlamydia sp. AcF125]
MNTKLIGGILLVSGTTIGAAMLALPVATGQAGFIPSFLLLAICWIYMTYTAFLILEANLWMEPDTNLITMARHTLGSWGAGLSWITYLFLLYSLTTAYIAVCIPIFVDIGQSCFKLTISHWIGALPLILVLGYFVYRGTESVDYLNRLLMTGLIMAYLAMTFLLAPHIQPTKFLHIEWSYLLLATSIIVTSFGFHIIIPTLTTYFKRDVPQIKKAILMGSIIPFIIYGLWEMLALGIIPLHGEHGIVAGYLHGIDGTRLLASTLHQSSITVIARFFSFFAIITSFLGVSLSLSDFLSDGLKIKKNQAGKLLLYLLTFLPPLLFTFICPRAFLTALEYAGAYGVMMLLGLLPPLIVWSGRYKKKYQSPFTAPGGKCSLVLTIVFALIFIGLEIANSAGWLNPFITS